MDNSLYQMLERDRRNRVAKNKNVLSSIQKRYPGPIGAITLGIYLSILWMVVTLAWQFFQ